MSMKYLLVTALILVVFWLWRHNRQADRNEEERSRPPAKPAREATEIVACAVCQVHLPRTEALPGRNGFYCSDAHRRQAGA